MPWTIKYSPKSLKEFVNQNAAIAKFLKWYESWRQHKKPCLIYGPPGTGKTCFVYAFAKERDLEIVELNASDFRDAETIKRVMGAAISQASLLGKGKIFLIDEVDGISGKEDRGGIGEIIKLLSEARNPVVFTANDAWDPKLRGLRELCELIEFKKLTARDIEKRLKEILSHEGIEAEPMVLKQIALRNDGDLRGAITDLETVARGKDKVTVKDLEVLGYREREQNIFETMKIIFKTKTVRSARLAIMSSDRDPEEIFWWIENNIFNEYEKPEEIAKAYEFLARADIFRRRVALRQNWRLMMYMTDLMASVCAAKKEMYRKFTKYTYPDRLKILAQTKAQREEETEKLRELARKLHCSLKKLRTEYLPYLKFLHK
jgi:replication factor C large subunit